MHIIKGQQRFLTTSLCLITHTRLRMHGTSVGKTGIGLHVAGKCRQQKQGGKISQSLCFLFRFFVQMWLKSLRFRLLTGRPGRDIMESSQEQRRTVNEKDHQESNVQVPGVRQKVLYRQVSRTSKLARLPQVRRL